DPEAAVDHLILARTAALNGHGLTGPGRDGLLDKGIGSIRTGDDAGRKRDDAIQKRFRPLVRLVRRFSRQKLLDTAPYARRIRAADPVFDASRHQRTPLVRCLADEGNTDVHAIADEEIFRGNDDRLALRAA